MLKNLNFPIHVVFNHMPENEQIKRYIKREANMLSEQCKRIENCDVNIDMPFPQRYPDNIYDLLIQMRIDQKNYEVHFSPSTDNNQTDLYRLIHQGFRKLSQKILKQPVKRRRVVSARELEFQSAKRRI